ncbi:uncharacterized protein RAG0_02252 [Rhynchosporium agropyri]|uniref:Uncharacterized protein n=1 Tax=Rhynchosporium agropyri TaxID=914238 RepID=A0A1E1K0Z3_9HELO|nr:uncharacterized protein RAG0_02252 [Rhynchosporium agropyri]
MPSTNGNPSRFELPQLTPVNYSLTEGTGIPPPPDSPIEEDVPAPAAVDASEQSHTTNGHGQSTTTTSEDTFAGRGRADSSADQPPMSPASSTRKGSMRRFLSRRSLNTNYKDGTNTNISQEDLAARPESAMSFASQRPSLAKKKSGSWFKRLGSSRRSSTIYEDKSVVATTTAPTAPVKIGPPPPKLPELDQFKAGIKNDDEGSLGAGDMFKDIK